MPEMWVFHSEGFLDPILTTTPFSSIFPVLCPHKSGSRPLLAQLRCEEVEKLHVIEPDGSWCGAQWRSVVRDLQVA